jgi:outer membrane lipoprotein-sorting protein
MPLLTSFGRRFQFLCFLLCLTVLPIAPSLRAQGANVAERFASVQKLASQREHFSVSFQQQSYSATTKKKRSSKGVLEFQKPKSFRWEILSPSQELFVNDGKEFWKYLALTKHAQRLPAGSRELDLADFLLNLSGVEKRYDIQEWKPGSVKSADTAKAEGESFFQPPEPKAGMLLLQLTPKEPQGYQEQVFLQIEEKKAEVREVRLRYRNGNRVTLIFDAWKPEKPAPERFRFVPPPGTAVDVLK